MVVLKQDLTGSVERLRQNLAESKAQLERLKERKSAGILTVHKGLSLISLVPKWSGLLNAKPLEEFLASIDRAASLGKWQDADCFNIAVLRLAEPAEAFYNSCPELHTKDS